MVRPARSGKRQTGYYRGEKARSGTAPNLSVKLSADDPAQLFPSEAPQYPALGRAVGSAWAEARQALFTLRSDWFSALNLQDPQKDALSRAQRSALDTALSQFLRTMAGETRTEAGFVSQGDEDGILQQSVYLANRVGMGRAVAESGHTPRNPALSTAQRERLARESFQRLSRDGELRFEGRLTSIRDRMSEAFRLGENPLAIARELSRSLDLEASRLRTLVRTEMGIAAIGGQVDVYREAGIRQVEVIGDTTTDELCTAHIGQEYSVNDTGNLPIYHPNCFCDVAPVTSQ
jgi:SPP1 gp7 family putative phage head morphogenesis protein